MDRRVAMRTLLAVSLLFVLYGLTGCASTGDPISSDTGDSDGELAQAVEFEVGSAAYDEGEEIPLAHAREGAGGENVSAPYTWTGAPGGARSYALVLMDLHPIARRWIHWMVVDIPADTESVELGASGTAAMPSGARELPNTWGDVGYGGPQPPEGSGAHEYRLTVYALDVEALDIADDGDLRAFLAATEDHVLAETTITGTFGE